MEINLLNIIPKEWEATQKRKHVRIHYKIISRGNNPKPFILPKSIKVDKEFMEACAMYIGDGKLSNDLHHLDFTSKDNDMVKFMLNFFTKRLNLKLKDIRFFLTYKKLKKNSIKKWAKYLNINQEQLHLKQSDRHKEECLRMQISGKIIRIIFGKIINNVLNSTFYKNSELRKAFLRGLFAAEGGIGINKKENYIVYMAYHLAFTEKKLCKSIQKLLKLEGIISKIKIRETKGERYIQITRWDNYWKMFSKGILNLNKRKKLKFLNKIKTTNFQCHLKDELISKLLNFKNISHRQLGIKLNIPQSSISRLKSRERKQLEFSHLLKLAKFNSISTQKIKEGIRNISIKGVTPIEDKNLINTLLTHKN